jgi:hypothetical protein
VHFTLRVASAFASLKAHARIEKESTRRLAIGSAEIKWVMPSAHNDTRRALDHRLASSAEQMHQYTHNEHIMQALLHSAHSAVCEIIAARQSRLHHTNLHLHRSTARARNAPAATAAGCIIICSECKTVALQLSEEQSPLK